MKKGKAAGIAIAVIAAAIVFGIASLPDEVLLDAPDGASENIPTETTSTEFMPEIIPPEVETPEEVTTPEVETPEEVTTPEVETPEEVTTPEVETPEEGTTPEEEPETEPETSEESDGNIIEIKISDGVGSGDR